MPIQTREQKECIRIGMRATCNDTVCMKNETSYNIDQYTRISPDHGLLGERARVDINQLCGQIPKMGNAYILEENPKATYGLFRIDAMDYAASKKRVLGFSFDSISAHDFAYKSARKIASSIARKEGIVEILDEVDEDTRKLRQRVREITERCNVVNEDIARKKAEKENYSSKDRR